MDLLFTVLVVLLASFTGTVLGNVATKTVIKYELPSIKRRSPELIQKIADEKEIRNLMDLWMYGQEEEKDV